MKKVSLFKRVAVIVIALVSMSVTAQAQDKDDIAVGVNAVLGSDYLLCFVLCAYCG
jgi:hypothetical protein